jgi:polyphosphate glucokinase
MNILVIDIGGNHVKLWKTDEAEKTKLPSGKDLTPKALIKGTKKATEDWPVERISIGYPGEVRNGRPVTEPDKLAPGWIDFDFEDAFNCPVRIMNDASMQALGSYKGGKMLFLGFGTGIGSALITDGMIVPLALGYLKLGGDKTIDECLSRKGLDEYGKKQWRKWVGEVTEMLKAALLVDYIMLGGGNVDEIDDLPKGCQRGGNHNAYFGGLRMWEDIADAKIAKIAALD